MMPLMQANPRNREHLGNLAQRLAGKFAIQDRGDHFPVSPVLRQVTFDLAPLSVGIIDLGLMCRVSEKSPLWLTFLRNGTPTCDILRR